LNTLPPFHVGARILMSKFTLLTILPGSRIWFQLMCFSLAQLHICLGCGQSTPKREFRGRNA
jgi:hypothetical protein